MMKCFKVCDKFDINTRVKINSLLVLFFSPRARTHGALVASLVDGDGLYSPGNSGLCLSGVPALSHHHLLQGHQKVGIHFHYCFSFLAAFLQPLRQKTVLIDESLYETEGG